MKKHINIPIFIPHLGCPNQCVFCNQRFISGVKEFDISSVRETIDQIISTVSCDTECEIAFFGGSFTGIDRSLMIKLLEISREYLSSGKISSVRCSTRPDYISKEILEILKEYGVKTIELGLQSISDDILVSCKRGHTSFDEKTSCELIKSFGFNLIGQMMIGLPSSTLKTEVETAEYIASIADGARIYPTVVFKNTELCDLYDAGDYHPLTEDDAIYRGAEVLKIFLKNNIPVIRIGLCESDNLSSEDSYKAGPNSPSLGEKIISKVYLDNLIDFFLRNSYSNEKVTISVAKGWTSKAIGNKKTNVKTIKDKFNIKDINFIESEMLEKFEFRVI